MRSNSLGNRRASAEDQRALMGVGYTSNLYVNRTHL